MPSRHISNENGGNLNLKGDRYKEWATTLEDSETHLAWYLFGMGMYVAQPHPLAARGQRVQEEAQQGQAWATADVARRRAGRPRDARRGAQTSHAGARPRP